MCEINSHYNILQKLFSKNTINLPFDEILVFAFLLSLNI